jgi:uncharacterized protein
MNTIGLQTTDGKWIARRVRLATSFSSRCIGLLRNGSLSVQDGLLLSPARSIHTLGMRFVIDVVFLSRRMQVLGLAPSVQPWRFRRAPRGTLRVLELAAGQIEASGLEIGSHVLVEEADSADDQVERSPPCPSARATRPMNPPCQRLPIQFSLRLPLRQRCGVQCGRDRGTAAQSSRDKYP